MRTNSRTDHTYIRSAPRRGSSCTRSLPSFDYDGNLTDERMGATSSPMGIPDEATEPTLELLSRRPITYRSALDTDKNIIHEARYVGATKALYQKLWEERITIEALVKHHVGLGDRDLCIVAHPRQWLRGSFNVCIPIEVESTGSSSRKLIMRCSMPHKLAEAENPGSIDEKMGSEVGTYAWMEERCPETRIPHLYGFGFYDHRHVRPTSYRPIIRSRSAPRY